MRYLSLAALSMLLGIRVGFGDWRREGVRACVRSICLCPDGTGRKKQIAAAAGPARVTSGKLPSSLVGHSQSALQASHGPAGASQRPHLSVDSQSKSLTWS
jgi:hypothetical protein